MRVIKFYVKGEPKIMRVVKVSPVLFDSRPDWVLVKEIDKIERRCEVFWIHPMDTSVEWVREFRF